MIKNNNQIPSFVQIPFSAFKCSSCALSICDHIKCAVWDQKRKDWLCSACDSFYSTSPACDWLFERLNKRFTAPEHPAPKRKPSPIAKLLNGQDRKRFDDVMLELNSELNFINVNVQINIL